MHMLAQVDLGEASCSQQFHQTIVSELLTDSVRHPNTSGTVGENALLPSTARAQWLCSKRTPFSHKKQEVANGW
jgi:hypothetical protein